MPAAIRSSSFRRLAGTSRRSGRGFRRGCTVLELGAGGGQLSSVLSTLRAVRRVVAFDYSQHMLADVLPQAVRESGGRLQRISVVCGDLDRTALRDGAFDVIVSALTFHHAHDPLVTMREAYRLLKPGGSLILFERSHADDVPDATLEAHLEIEFSPKKKKTYGLPVDARITRRMMGEHEYRTREWRAFLERASFRVRTAAVHRPDSRRLVCRAARKLPVLQRVMSRVWELQLRGVVPGATLVNVFPGRHMGNRIFFATKVS